MSLLLQLQTGLKTASATFVGAGVLQATPVRVRTASVVFDGVGFLSATGAQVVHIASVSFVGVGVLSATPIKISGAVTVGGAVRRRKPEWRPRRPDWEIVQDLQHDILGPPEESPIPEWLRAEEDLATLILAEHL